MKMPQAVLCAAIVCSFALLSCARVRAEPSDVDRLIAALLGDTPLAKDLRQLTDEIGGRPTGSKANRAAVDWSLQKFKSADVTVHKEAFMMPQLWLERSCEAKVSGDLSFAVRTVSMPFSAPTPKGGIKAPLVAAGHGTQEDFERLGDSVKDAFILVETPLLLDIEGLFREYTESATMEPRAFAAGVRGIVYMSSRGEGILYRHNAALGLENKHPILAMERGQAQRVLRLLRSGKKLELWTRIELDTGGPYESHNVIGEIAGTDKANEVVIIGAHLDSWGLGEGANDNGCNVAMMIDIARQIQRLGIRPRRTIRFALWNGEEQGLLGSWAYTVDHADELDDHVMACSIDIGSGRISGFFTNGRPELLELVDTALSPLQGLGPFEQVDVPIVGTDNYDFMMQGVGNLVANHESYNYGPNYHASSDNYDKVDLRQLRLNTAIVAAVTWGFANGDVTWERQTRQQVQSLVDDTGLGEQMRTFRYMQSWEERSRGRR
jgi:carboxypeptidase Q